MGILSTGEERVTTFALVIGERIDIYINLK